MRSGPVRHGITEAVIPEHRQGGGSRVIGRHGHRRGSRFRQAQFRSGTRACSLRRLRAQSRPLLANCLILVLNVHGGIA